MHTLGYRQAESRSIRCRRDLSRPPASALAARAHSTPIPPTPRSPGSRPTSARPSRSAPVTQTAAQPLPPAVTPVSAAAASTTARRPMSAAPSTKAAAEAPPSRPRPMSALPHMATAAQPPPAFPTGPTGRCAPDRQTDAWAPGAAPCCEASTVWAARLHGRRGVGSDLGSVSPSRVRARMRAAPRLSIHGCLHGTARRAPCRSLAALDGGAHRLRSVKVRPPAIA